MTISSQELRQIGVKMYGATFRPKLAAALGLGLRNLQRMLAGKIEIPAHLGEKARALTNESGRRVSTS